MCQSFFLGCPSLPNALQFLEVATFSRPSLSICRSRKSCSFYTIILGDPFSTKSPSLSPILSDLQHDGIAAVIAGIVFLRGIRPYDCHRRCCVVMRRAVMMMMVAVVVMVWRSVNDPGVLGVAVVGHYGDDDEEEWA